MKIAIDGRMILPQMTGAGRYILELTRALLQLHEDIHYELWTQPGLPKDHPVWALKNVGLQIHILPIQHMDFRQMWALPAAVRQRKPDLLHYPHFDLPWGVPGPVVVTLYDLKYIARPEFFPAYSRPKQTLMKILMAHTLRRADRVIAISQSTRQDLIQHLNANASKVGVVPLGVSETYFESPPPQEIQRLRQRHGLEQPFLLFVGERRPHKNLEGLIRAYAKIAHNHQDGIDLVIAGKSYAGYQEPQRLVTSLRLGSKVHFLDSVSDDELNGLYHIAQAFVLLSYYEGFGLPVLEAMAAGIPVVAANTSALPEVTGGAALLVDPDDPGEAAQAIEKILEDQRLRESLIAQGLMFAHAFTWERCAHRTLEVYREALAL